MSDLDELTDPPKRTDVGYGRPPVEWQFKKGQKPPPRRKRSVEELSFADLFWQILQERRKTMLKGRPAWSTNAELIVRRAYMEAEKGSAVLNRLLHQLLLDTEPERENDMPEIILDPRPRGEGEFDVETMTIMEEPPAFCR